MRNQILAPIFEEKLGEQLSNMSPIEQFQNNCLRPILKFQNERVLAIFEQYMLQNKPKNLQVFDVFIKESIQKNQSLQLCLRHQVIAFFTDEQWQWYWQNTKEVHKRIQILLIERLQSQQQYFFTIL